MLMKKKHPPCCGGCGGLMSFWLPPSARWSLDPGLRRENDEINRRQSRPLSRFFGSSTLTFDSPASAQDLMPRWGCFHVMALSTTRLPQSPIVFYVYITYLLTY